MIRSTSSSRCHSGSVCVPWLVIHPKITSFLHWVGMVPAFRFGFEGGEGIESNFSSFDQVSERLNAGYPFVVFPEAGHTQGHYLGRFTTGTVRIRLHQALLFTGCRT